MDKRGDLKLILAFLGLAAAVMFFRIVTFVPEIGTESGGEQIVQFIGGEIIFDRCGEITTGGVYVLNQSLILNETCIIINADDVTLNGNGFKITGNGSWNGIEIIGRDNVLINNIAVENYSNGIFIKDSTNWVIADSAFGYGNEGMQIISDEGVIYNVDTENNAGVGINMSGSNNVIANSPLKSYKISAPSGMSYQNLDKAEIKFLEEIIANGTNFANDVKLDYNYAYVDSSKAGLNKSAEITFYNLPMNMAKPMIWRNDAGCNATTNPGCVNYTSLNAGNVTFSVSSWSSYTIHDEDVTPPAIEFVEPSEEDDWIDRNDIKINVSVNDAAFVSLVINFFNSTGLKNSTIWTTSNAYVNIKGLKEGTYYFNATATDNAGNEASSETRKVIIDLTEPTATIHSPKATTYTANTYLINISLSERGYCEYGIGNGSARYDLVDEDNNYFLGSKTGVSNGNYVLTAYCKDRAGNSDEKSVSFKVSAGSSNNQQTNTTNRTTSGSSGNRQTTTTRTNMTSNTGGTSKNTAGTSGAVFYILLSVIIAASAALVIIIVMIYVIPSMGKPAWQKSDITPLAKFNYLVDDIERALNSGDFRKVDELYPNIGLFFRYLSPDEQARVKARAEKIYYDIEMARRSAGA